MISGLSVNWNTPYGIVREFQNVYTVYSTAHLTAVQNLEHDDLTHKPSSIFALLMEMILFFRWTLAHAMAIKSLPQSFQIIVIIMMGRQSQWNFRSFPSIVIILVTWLEYQLHAPFVFTFIQFFLFF